MESSRRGSSRAGGDYEASPVPAGVVYPEPPIRSQTSHRQRPRRDAEGDRDRNTDGHGDGGRTRERDEGRGREGETGGPGAPVEELRSQSPAPLDRPISLFDGE